MFDTGAAVIVLNDNYGLTDLHLLTTPVVVTGITGSGITVTTGGNLDGIEVLYDENLSANCFPGGTLVDEGWTVFYDRSIDAYLVTTLSGHKLCFQRHLLPNGRVTQHYLCHPRRKYTGPTEQGLLSFAPTNTTPATAQQHLANTSRITTTQPPATRPTAIPQALAVDRCKILGQQFVLGVFLPSHHLAAVEASDQTTDTIAAATKTMITTAHPGFNVTHLQSDGGSGTHSHDIADFCANNNIQLVRPSARQHETPTERATRLLQAEVRNITSRTAPSHPTHQLATKLVAAAITRINHRLDQRYKIGTSQLTQRTYNTPLHIAWTDAYTTCVQSSCKHDNSDSLNIEEQHIWNQAVL
jgi:hypothetical protein